MHKQRRDPSEIGKLKDIIGIIFGVDIDKKTRRVPYPSARAVFTKVLLSIGYGYTEIGRFLDKNHATIIHYNNQIDTLIQHDQQLRMKYEEVIKNFGIEENPIHKMSDLELKKEVIALKSQNKKLYLEKELIMSRVQKEIYFQDVLDLIKERIGKTDKEKVKKVLTRYFNGVRN